MAHGEGPIPWRAGIDDRLPHVGFLEAQDKVEALERGATDVAGPVARQIDAALAGNLDGLRKRDSTVELKRAKRVRPDWKSKRQPANERFREHASETVAGTDEGD